MKAVLLLTVILAQGCVTPNVEKFKENRKGYQNSNELDHWKRDQVHYEASVVRNRIILDRKVCDKKVYKVAYDMVPVYEEFDSEGRFILEKQKRDKIFPETIFETKWMCDSPTEQRYVEKGQAVLLIEGTSTKIDLANPKIKMDPEVATELLSKFKKIKADRKAPEFFLQYKKQKIPVTDLYSVTAALEQIIHDSKEVTD